MTLTNENSGIFQKNRTSTGKGGVDQMELWQAIITGVITGAFSAGSIWGVLSTRLAFMQRDITLAHERLDRHEDRHHAPRKVA